MARALPRLAPTIAAVAIVALIIVIGMYQFREGSTGHEGRLFGPSAPFGVHVSIISADETCVTWFTANETASAMLIISTRPLAHEDGMGLRAFHGSSWKYPGWDGLVHQVRSISAN